MERLSKWKAIIHTVAHLSLHCPILTTQCLTAVCHVHCDFTCSFFLFHIPHNDLDLNLWIQRASVTSSGSGSHWEDKERRGYVFKGIELAKKRRQRKLIFSVVQFITTANWLNINLDKSNRMELNWRANVKYSYAGWSIWQAMCLVGLVF